MKYEMVDEYTTSRAASLLALIMAMLIMRDYMVASWQVAAPLWLLLVVELLLWARALLVGVKRDHA